MNTFKELQILIDEFSEKISINILEKRIYEISEIKAIAKIHLWFSIKECLQLLISVSEKKHRELTQLYIDPKTPNYKKKKIQIELTKLKAEKKDSNRLLHTISDYNEYEQLKHYVEDKFGYSTLQDFYENYCNKDNFRVRKELLNNK